MTDWATRGECCGGRHDRKFRSIPFSNKTPRARGLAGLHGTLIGLVDCRIRAAVDTLAAGGAGRATAACGADSASWPDSRRRRLRRRRRRRARNDSASACGCPTSGCETRAARGRRPAGAAARRDTAAGSAAASELAAGGPGRPGPWPRRCCDPERDRHENRHADSRNAAVDFRRHRRSDQAAGRSDADRGAAIYAGAHDRPLRREFAVRHHQGSRLRGSAFPRRLASAGRCRDHVRDPSHRSVRAGAHRGSSRPVLGPVRPDAAGRPDQHDEQAPDRRSTERNRRATRQLQSAAGYVRLQRSGRFPGRMALSAGRAGAAQRYATRLPAGQSILHRAELHVAERQYPLDRPDQRPGLLGARVPAVRPGIRLAEFQSERPDSLQPVPRRARPGLLQAQAAECRMGVRTPLRRRPSVPAEPALHQHRCRTARVAHRRHPSEPADRAEVRALCVRQHQELRRRQSLPGRFRARSDDAQIAHGRRLLPDMERLRLQVRAGNADRCVRSDVRSAAGSGRRRCSRCFIRRAT